MATDIDRNELLRKYKLAGRIRFISFTLLFLFLLTMKLIGGYAYLNIAFIALIIVEAFLNQPYGFIVRRVDIYRFQYYQMAVDIIAISWALHYMGGIEAPLITIAYYAVILWAGVASSVPAVFFAVFLSALFFSLVVVLGYIGVLPFITYYNYKMPVAQMISLLLGNVSFFFAFGYFSAYSASVIKFLQRRRQEESLRNIHKLAATGQLVSRTAHDILNYLASIGGYTRILLDEIGIDSQKQKMLVSIEKLQHQSVNALERLGKFSQRKKQQFNAVDVNKAVEDALALTWPIMRYLKINITKSFAHSMPQVIANENQLHEVFIVIILNAIDAMGDKGTLAIRTSCLKGEDSVEVVFSDTGAGIKKENLKKIGEPFFTTKGPGEGLGLGLATAYGIINLHKGKVYVQSKEGKGTAFTIRLPV